MWVFYHLQMQPEDKNNDITKTWSMRMNKKSLVGQLTLEQMMDSILTESVYYNLS